MSNTDLQAPDASAAVFTPLHKRAFGMATGLVAALVVFLATAIHVIRNPDPPFPLHLLAQYFAGYEVSWTGALVGAAWAGFSGFVMGWFLAFCRNILLAVFVFIIRAKAELTRASDLLDQI